MPAPKMATRFSTSIPKREFFYGELGQVFGVGSNGQLNFARQVTVGAFTFGHVHPVGLRLVAVPDVCERMFFDVGKGRQVAATVYGTILKHIQR